VPDATVGFVAVVGAMVVLVVVVAVDAMMAEIV